MIILYENNIKMNVNMSTSSNIKTAGDRHII